MSICACVVPQWMPIAHSAFMFMAGMRFSDFRWRSTEYISSAPTQRVLFIAWLTKKNKKIEKKTSTNMKNEKWHDASRGEHIKRHIARHERVKMMMTCIPRWFIRLIYGLRNGTRMKCRHARSTPEKKKTDTHKHSAQWRERICKPLCCILLVEYNA